MSEPVCVQSHQGKPLVEDTDSAGKQELRRDTILSRILPTLATEQGVPSTAQRHHENKAREILNGIAEYRIDPIRVKITDDKPRGEGGQGVVMIGTLVPKEGVKEFGLEGIEELFSGRWEELVSEIPEELRPEGPKGALLEQLRKLVSEAIGQQTRERQVAVKKLEWPHDDAEESTKFFKSFVNELSVMASISHPNIIKFLGFVEDMKKGDAWIVLPWEANGNVRDFLQSGEWDLPERVSLIQDTAKGLQYLHTHDPPICHGDLKSLNVLVNSSYRAVITDFGSARVKVKPNFASENRYETPCQTSRDDDKATEFISPQAKFNGSSLYLTLTGAAFSIRWTAPEVLREGVQDLPSDMWAVGWICWEIVTGRVPFEGENRAEVIINQAVHGELPAIREDAHLSHVLRLCSLMSDCWVSNPAMRIDSSTFERKMDLLPSETPVPSTPGGEKIRSAGLLIKQGRLSKLQNRMDEAEKHFRSAIEVASRAKDEALLATALTGLGGVYDRRSDYGKAEGCYKEAQEIHARIGNGLGVGEALQGLGNTYRAGSKNQEAERVDLNPFPPRSSE